MKTKSAVTLLDAAKAAESYRGIRDTADDKLDEKIELLFAWIKGEIGPMAIATALKFEGRRSNAYQVANRFIVNTARSAWKHGRLILSEKKRKTP